ncbi:hypothetical protein HG530_009417 [Fusarium avenaceum]|nr:hypothetical protein HG530_009417 [Fusarium avenaceum]
MSLRTPTIRAENNIQERIGAAAVAAKQGSRLLSNFRHCGGSVESDVHHGWERRVDLGLASLLSHVELNATVVDSLGKSGCCGRLEGNSDSSLNIDERVVKETQLELFPHQFTNRLVNASFRNKAFVDEFDDELGLCLAAEDITSSFKNTTSTLKLSLVLQAPKTSSNDAPVCDNNTLEAELVLEQISDNTLIEAKGHLFPRSIDRTGIFVVPRGHAPNIVHATTQNVVSNALAGNELFNSLVKSIIDNDSAAMEHLTGLVLEGHARHEVIDTLV